MADLTPPRSARRPPSTARAERLQLLLMFAQTDLQTLTPEDSTRLQGDLADTIWFGSAPEPKRLRGDIAQQARQAGDWRQRTAAGREPVLRPDPAVYAIPDGFPLPFEDLVTLQTDLKRLFDAVAVDATQEPQETRHISLSWMRIDLQTAVTGVDIYVPSVCQTTVYVKGAPRDLLLYVVLLLLFLEPSGSIQVCPECRTLFFRTGKQRYCSRACTNRSSIRQFRARKGATHTEERSDG